MRTKEWPGKYPITCKTCGKEKLAQKPTQQYCSRECANCQKSHITRICLYCGETFRVIKSARKNNLWCSSGCYKSYKHIFPEFQPASKAPRPDSPIVLNKPKPVQVPKKPYKKRGMRTIGDTYKCRDCGQDYTLEASKQRRCKPCQKIVSQFRDEKGNQAKLNQRLASGEFVFKYSTKPCKECGKDFIPQSWLNILCDDCRSHKRHMGPRLIPTQPCEVCGWEFNVNRHRINPGKNGGAYKPENIMHLCPNHHFAVHSGLAYIDENRNYKWIKS